MVRLCINHIPQADVIEGWKVRFLRVTWRWWRPHNGTKTAFWTSRNQSVEPC